MITLLELLIILQRAKRGQFSVIFKIFEYLPEAKEAKAHLDYVIDLCGEPPKGEIICNIGLGSRHIIPWYFYITR